MRFLPGLFSLALFALGIAFIAALPIPDYVTGSICIIAAPILYVLQSSIEADRTSRRH